MKVTRRQLKRLISEAFSGYASERPRNPMERHYANVINSYETWVQEKGHITPAASSVLATYLIDQGLEQDTERTSILASEYKIDKLDVASEIKRQVGDARIKYDDVVLNQDVPKLILKFQGPMGQRQWLKVRNEFYNMSEGGDEYGIRQKYYPGWTNEDFIAVITAVEGSYSP